MCVYISSSLRFVLFESEIFAFGSWWRAVNSFIQTRIVCPTQTTLEFHFAQLSLCGRWVEAGRIVEKTSSWNEWRKRGTTETKSAENKRGQKKPKWSCCRALVDFDTQFCHTFLFHFIYFSFGASAFRLLLVLGRCQFLLPTHFFYKCDESDNRSDDRQK